HRRHGRGGGRARARRGAVPRRRAARRAEPARAPLRGGLRPRPRHRVGTRRRHRLPAPVPRPNEGRRLVAGPPVRGLRRVALSADLDDAELAQVAALFKERRFAAGETVVKEGADGAAFFLIDSGEAAVSVRGTERASLGPGDHFGEIALIDEGVRSATISATTDLVCYGLTLWEFRPLVIENGNIGWKLLHSLAKKLRTAES